MREIKFRAWDKITTGMYYWIEIDREGYAFYLDNGKREGYSPFNSHLACLMQFTGLKDKNGKEIYEGDICKMVILEGQEKRNPPEALTAIVEHKNGCFGYRFTHQELHHPDDKGWKAFWKCEDKELIDMGYFEIIGNIYEHKHLLEEKRSENI